MPGKNHSLTSVLEEMAAITCQAFVVLQCDNAGGSNRLSQAFPALCEDDIHTLSEGPLIVAYNTDAEARDGYNEMLAKAVEGYETTCSIISSTITFIGRANEGECSRTGVLKLVAEINSADPAYACHQFAPTGHVIMPRANTTSAR